MGRRAPDDGQAVPLLFAVVALGLVCVVSAGRLCRVWADAARARSAADAAAIACVLGGPSAASSAAVENGATLLSVTAGSARCTVEVSTGSASARATAAWREVLPRTTAPPHHEG